MRMPARTGRQAPLLPDTSHTSSLPRWLEKGPLRCALLGRPSVLQGSASPPGKADCSHKPSARHSPFHVQGSGHCGEAAGRAGAVHQGPCGSGGEWAGTRPGSSHRRVLVTLTARKKAENSEQGSPRFRRHGLRRQAPHGVRDGEAEPRAWHGPVGTVPSRPGLPRCPPPPSRGQSPASPTKPPSHPWAGQTTAPTHPAPTSPVPTVPNPQQQPLSLHVVTSPYLSSYLHPGDRGWLEGSAEGESQ